MIARGGFSDEVQLSQVPASEKPDDVTICEGCDYHIIGDDAEAVGRTCLRRGNVGFRFLQPRMPNFEEGDTRNTWARFLDRALEAQGVDKAPHAVNLVGLGPASDVAVRELIELLAQAGIEVASVVMPGLPPGAERAFARGALTVASPWQPVDEAFADPMRRRNMPVASLAVPYGVTGTLRWLDAVRTSLGMAPLNGDMRRAMTARYEGFGAATGREHDGAPVRVGVVYDMGTLRELLSPRFFFGADVLEMLGDAGLSLTVVHLPMKGQHYSPESSAAARILAAGGELAEHAPGTPIERVVQEHRLDLVYCDILQPFAVKRAGAVPIHIRDFELGLAGAVRNLQRLRAARRLSFYRDMGRYL